LRKKKDVMSEEQSDMLCLFLNLGGAAQRRGGMFPPSRSSCLSRDEKTSRNNPKSIYSDGGEESRDIVEEILSIERRW